MILGGALVVARAFSTELLVLPIIGAVLLKVGLVWNPKGKTPPGGRGSV